MGRFRTYFCTAIGVWALLLMPALCVGGVLMHPCECTHSEDADHPEESGCGHESHCAADPCGDIVTKPDETQNVSLEIDGAFVGLPILITHVEPRVLIPITWSSPQSYLGLASHFAALASTVLLI